MKQALVVELCVLASLAYAGQAPKEPPDAARIAQLCKQLGETEYGSLPACRQLIEIGEPAMPYLLKALKDRRPQARWWAVAAVCRIGADEGYQPVLEVLRNDPHAFVRSTAVYYLRHYRKKGKEIWPHVERALAEKHSEVGRWALRLMVEDGYPKLDQELRKILASGNSELRSYALGHVRDMGDKGKTYLPLVRQLLATKDPRVRYDALHTTVVLMDSGQLELLRGTYHKDKDPIVKECALRCVTVIQPQPPVEGIELFILGLHNEDKKVRKTAHKLLRKGCKQYFGYDAEQPLPIREASIKKWREWYQRNRSKLQWHSDLRKFLLPGQREEKPADSSKTPKGEATE